MRQDQLKKGEMDYLAKICHRFIYQDLERGVRVNRDIIEAIHQRLMTYPKTLPSEYITARKRYLKT